MHASTDQMVATANHLSSIADQIDERHRVVRDDVETLVGSKWQGIAPRTHEELWDSWDDGYVDVVRALRAMSEKITAAAAHFSTTDAANATVLNHSGTGVLNMDVS